MNIHDGDDDDDDEPDVRVGVTARCPPILPSRQANSVQCVRVFVYSSPCVAFVREHRYARSMQHHMTNSRPTMRTVCVLERRHHHHYLQRPAHADGAAGAVAAGDLVGISRTGMAARARDGGGTGTGCVHHQCTVRPGRSGQVPYLGHDRYGDGYCRRGVFFFFCFAPLSTFLSLLKARAQPARGGDSVDDMRRMEHQVVVV